MIQQQLPRIHILSVRDPAEHRICRWRAKLFVYHAAQTPPGPPRCLVPFSGSSTLHAFPHPASEALCIYSPSIALGCMLTSESLPVFMDGWRPLYFMMISPIIYAQLFRSGLSLSGSSVSFPDFSISLSLPPFTLFLAYFISFYPFLTF